MTVQSQSLPRARSGPFSDSDPVVLVLTIGFILLFVGASIIDSSYVADLIGAGFAWTATYLGSFFQLLLLLTFFIAIGTALSRAGAARIGGLEKPEIGRFRWLSMIMCTLLAGGGVFFAAGEPVYHFVVTPPHLTPKPAPPQRSPRLWPSRLLTGDSWPGQCSAPLPRWF